MWRVRGNEGHELCNTLLHNVLRDRATYRGTAARHRVKTHDRPFTRLAVYTCVQRTDIVQGRLNRIAPGERMTPAAHDLPLAQEISYVGNFPAMVYSID